MFHIHMVAAHTFPVTDQDSMSAAGEGREDGSSHLFLAPAVTPRSNRGTMSSHVQRHTFFVTFGNAAKVVEGVDDQEIPTMTTVNTKTRPTTSLLNRQGFRYIPSIGFGHLALVKGDKLEQVSPGQGLRGEREAV
jgi:hypothetical protein